MNDLKKELSLSQKGVKPLKKRGMNILKILILVFLPQTLDELVNLMEFKSKNSFREDYVKTSDDF